MQTMQNIRARRGKSRAIFSKPGPFSHRCWNAQGSKIRLGFSRVINSIFFARTPFLELSDMLRDFPTPLEMTKCPAGAHLRAGSRAPNRSTVRRKHSRLDETGK